MKAKVILCSIFWTLATSVLAQDVFKTTLHNKEYNIMMQIDLYGETVSIPGQDIFGKTYGYIKYNPTLQAWIITGVTLSDDGKSAHLEIVNDYGSEDLDAEMTLLSDGTYCLKQLDGSPLKFYVNRKSNLKLPKTIVFNKKQN